ncbi:(4Fe-4S)-binding protein [Thiofilum flexile]|uniref:(4Fe-4S)-binding protein n=1 Tax=Thiofilum flexile TaxID=125627 RepID=UPI0003829CDD|nr:(4Fe-4S)-binding protein [Thiofilum flexile]
MTEAIVKHYSNGEITVIWQPAKCIHSRKCFHGLPNVFNPQARPWVNIQGADTAAIKAQIDQCPSGALSYQLGGTETQTTSAPAPSLTIVQVMPNGPLLVQGTIAVKLADGSESVKEQRCALCRCGASANKPFCDGSHVKAGFVG